MDAQIRKDIEKLNEILMDGKWTKAVTEVLVPIYRRYNFALGVVTVPMAIYHLEGLMIK